MNKDNFIAERELHAMEAKARAFSHTSIECSILCSDVVRLTSALRDAYQVVDHLRTLQKSKIADPVANEICNKILGDNCSNIFFG